MVEAYQSDAVHFLCALFQLLGQGRGLFVGHSLQLLAGFGMFGHQFLDGAGEVRSVVEDILDGLQEVFHVVDALHGLGARNGLDTAHAGGHGTLGHNLEQADGAGAAGMGATAKLYGVAESHHAYHVPVLFAEQGHGAHLAGLLHGGVALFDEREVRADELVHADFYSA